MYVWKGEKNSKLLNGRDKYLEQIKNKLLSKEIMKESDQPLHSCLNLLLKIGSLADGNISCHLSTASAARFLHGPPAPPQLGPLCHWACFPLFDTALDSLP